MRPEDFYPDRITVVTGKKQHEIVLPQADNIAVRYWINADDTVILYLYSEEKLIPLDIGTRLRGSIRVHSVSKMVVVCKDKTIVAAEVYAEECRLQEPGGGPPCEIVAVPTPVFTIQDLINYEMAKRQGLDPNEEVDVGDDLEDLMDEEPDDFTGGSEENEQEDAETMAEKFAPEWARRKPKPKKGSDPDPAPGGGGNPDSLLKPDAKPGPGEADSGDRKQPAPSAGDPQPAPSK